ncbi:unnamed protein product [Dracunculus medinensis]|uniref:Pept_C1 domain-containing protein n=1 Tax=Dracunculus medinensis TaxID=318479 RepID=A0A0N4UPY9_DRAME|nr:unnamed protein product [Dracunculus medinensis]
MNNKVGKARHREARGALEYRVVNDNARRDEYFQWKLYFLLAFILLSTIFITLYIVPMIIYDKSSEAPIKKNELSEYFLELTHRINSEASWKAEYNANAFNQKQLKESGTQIRQAENYSSTMYEEDYLKNYAETFRSRKNYKLMHDMLTKVQIPLSAMKKFDCRGHWPICSSAIGKIYDQGACWLYWLYTTVSTTEDRLCISSNGKSHIKLSKFHILACCKHCGNCKGGDPEEVYMHWIKYGVTSELCQPSNNLLSLIDKSCGQPCALSLTKKADRTIRKNINSCFSDCFNPEHKYLDVYDRKQDNVHYGLYVNLIERSVISDRRPKQWYRGETIHRQLTIDNIRWLDLVKKEIYLRGPISVDLLVYEDFLLYKSGIYDPISQSSENELFRYHVKIIGWELVNNETVFLGVNTWGTSWGEKG